MSFIMLDVPHIGQRNIGEHAGEVTHTEQNGCWYASTCMVSYFWEAGPRLGVPAQYADDPTDPAPMGARYQQLKNNENYEGVLLPAGKKWTIYKLYNVLENFGPCYVRRRFIDRHGKLSGGHAVVLAGANITTGEVVLLDPWYSSHTEGEERWRQKLSIDTFNSIFNWEEYVKGTSLMYKKQDNPFDGIKHISTHCLKAWP